MAVGIPVSLLRGDMADVEKQTKSYMFFTVAPILKKIKDEADVKFFTQKEFLDGQCIDIRKASYQNIFDLATAVDKLRASGIMNGNEIRTELGLESVDDEIMTKYFITKNYQESSQALGGGEYGTATALEVLTGKTFGTEDGLANGVMINWGSVGTVGLTGQNEIYTIPQGYRNGAGKMTATYPKGVIE